jgi:hypothetical protein
MHFTRELECAVMQTSLQLQPQRCDLQIRYTDSHPQLGVIHSMSSRYVPPSALAAPWAVVRVGGRQGRLAYLIGPKASRNFALAWEGHWSSAEGFARESVTIPHDDVLASFMERPSRAEISRIRIQFGLAQ